jgi:acyloxyacyl hydrolase
LIGDLFGKIINNGLSKNPGNDCAGCTVVISLIEQLAQVHNKSVAETVSEACDLLPEDFKAPCQAAVVLYGPSVIKFLENHDTPDEVCQQINLCKNSTCNLYPRDSKTSKRGPRTNPLVFIEISSVDLPTIVWPWTKVGDHLPALDEDDDKFGILPTLRGTHWRGMDCDDFVEDIYPGRNVNNYGASVDHNCNGIKGTDPNSGKSYEELLCEGTPQYGFIVLGDSAAAHFHIPPQWMTPAQINNMTYKNMLDIMEDELDWPEESASTGFMNETWSGHPVGPLNSLYLKMRERNLCMHRDYQNIAVNGARSSAMNRTIADTMARNQLNDLPVNIGYSLIGNDVCNGHIGLGHMTTPDEFYHNVLGTLEWLDTQLPAGSHLSFMGLVDGRVLYDNMHDRIHPLGELNQDITYTDFYDYMNCLEISPCFGWMNSDAYWRNATTERAMELNAMYLEIIANHTFTNFNMTYFDCPMPEVLQIWEASGGQAWQIIEPIDGFHPNQIANAILAEVQWNKYLANHTYLIPPINPNNEQILKLFGDQGGYGL